MNENPEYPTPDQSGTRLASSARRTSWRLVALFFFTLLICLPGTRSLPLTDRDEAYYAEVSREMNGSGDYMVPHFNGKAWLEKPPLLFWAQCVSFKLFGENEFAVRLPCAIAAALTALVIFGFCSALYDERAAWRAAICFVLCVETAVLGRLGLTDMPLTLFTTIAAWAGWMVCKGGARKCCWWIFYLAIAGAALAKGPVAALPLGTVLLFAMLARDPGVLAAMKFERGITLTLLVAALWYVPVQAWTGGDLFVQFFGGQVWEKVVHSQQGHGPANMLLYPATLPFYFLLVFPEFLPWSVYIPAAVRRMKSGRTRGDLYLASGILVTFGLFSLMRTKLPHYTLPAFPLIACAVAPCIPQKSFLRLSVITAVVLLAIGFFAAPLSTRCSAPLQLAARPELRKEMAAAVAPDCLEPGMIWYLRGSVKAWISRVEPEKMTDFMREPGPRFCILPAKQAAGLSVDPAWKKFPAEGIDLVHGRWMKLLMFVKTDSPGGHP